MEALQSCFLQDVLQEDERQRTWVQISNGVRQGRDPNEIQKRASIGSGPKCRLKDGGQEETLDASSRDSLAQEGRMGEEGLVGNRCTTRGYQKGNDGPETEVHVSFLAKLI